jgi:hypothetical protein
MNEDMQDDMAQWAVEQNQEEAKKVYQEVALGPYKPAHSPHFFDAIKLKHQVVKEMLE